MLLALISSHRASGFVAQCAAQGGLFFLLFSALVPAKVYLTEDVAPATLFPEAERFERQVVDVTPELQQRLETMMDPRSPWEHRYTTFIAKSSAEPIGYAVILNEIGKTRPITFIVGITPEGTVRGVEIMAYREPRGGEVRQKRFLRQYRGKRIGDPLWAHQDIVNITGATLSVRGVNRGVKKALALVEKVYLKSSQENRNGRQDEPLEE